MDFIGNKSKIEMLRKNLDKGVFLQSYIFSGPEGVGKFTLAKAFATGIINGKDISFDEKGHIDLQILAPEIEEKRGVIKERDISIESVRGACKDLSLYPQSGRKKVLIINNAHKLTISSQNALLKTLEEPNSSSVIILVTHNEGRILGTIKSRCSIINFSLCKEEDVISPFGLEIAALSMGRPGLAKRISVDPEERSFYEDAAKKISIMEKGDLLSKLELAEEMSKNSSQLIRILNIWVWNIRKKSLERGMYEDSFSLIEKIENSINLLVSTNVNSRLLLENLLINS